MFIYVYGFQITDRFQVKWRRVFGNVARGGNKKTGMKRIFLIYTILCVVNVGIYRIYSVLIPLIACTRYGYIISVKGFQLFIPYI